MKTTKQSYRNDIITGVIGCLIVWVGADVINTKITKPDLFDNNWLFGLVLVIFGSMIIGVAINKTSMNFRANNSSKKNSSKNGKK
jgi:uncharacterized integral membrane protein